MLRIEPERRTVRPSSFSQRDDAILAEPVAPIFVSRVARVPSTHLAVESGVSEAVNRGECGYQRKYGRPSRERAIAIDALTDLEEAER